MSQNIEYLQNLSAQQAKRIEQLEREVKNLEKEVEQLKQERDDRNNLTQVQRAEHRIQP